MNERSVVFLRDGLRGRLYMVYKVGRIAKEMVYNE